MNWVDFKCRNCGAALRTKGSAAVCDYCGSVYFQLTDSDCPEDCETLSLEAFSERIKAGQRTFSVDFGAGTIANVDDTVRKAKLRQAGKFLSEGKFFRVEEALKGIPETDFAAKRLRFLAQAGARDEGELAAYAGDLSEFSHYRSMLAACGEQTRTTYETVASVCLKNREILRNIEKGRELLRAEAWEDGLRYARDMIRQYPFHARAWELLAAAKCGNDPAYDPRDDLGRMTACPDAAWTVTGGETDFYGVPKGISVAVAERCQAFVRKESARSEFLTRYVWRPLLVLAAVGALIGIWQLIALLAGG